MCSLFGILDYRGSLTGKQKSKIISALATECEERGKDATGIAYNHNGNLSIYKRPKAAHLLRYYIQDDTKLVMGHTRLTTQGSEKKNFNNHPFLGKVKSTSFALAHNGMIYNDDKLQKSEKLPKTKIQTDSYVAVQLIEKQKELSFKTLAQMAEKLDGSYAFTVLDNSDNLWIVKGDNPLCIYHFPKLGCYIYASTENILKRTLKKLKMESVTSERINLLMGEILCIDQSGNMERSKFDFQNHIPYRMWRSESFFLEGDFEIVISEEVDDEYRIYLDELMSMSGYFGFTPDDIKHLYEQGFSCEEIEEILYEESWCNG